MNDLIYNDTLIRVRDEMLNLTDMWKAAGNDPSKRPADWARKEGSQFIEFVRESLNMPEEHIWISERGRYGDGTWAHWQIGLAYAKYLSHEFHAACNHIIRERMEGKLVPAPIEEDPATQMARGLIAAQKLLEEKDKKIEEQGKLIEEQDKKIDEIEPAAKAFYYLEKSEGSQSLTQTAKVLGIPPRKFIYGLQEKRWIYKHPLSDVWLGYSNHTKNGDLEHVYHEYEGKDGQRHHRVQVLVTVQGTAKLAKMLGNGVGPWQLF